MPTSHNDEPPTGKAGSSPGRNTAGSLRCCTGFRVLRSTQDMRACLTPARRRYVPKRRRAGGRAFFSLLQTHAERLQTETGGDSGREAQSTDRHASILARISTAGIRIYLLPFVQLPLLGNGNIRHTNSRLPLPPVVIHAGPAPRGGTAAQCTQPIGAGF